jgi:hypothetical protein
MCDGVWPSVNKGPHMVVCEEWARRRRVKPGGTAGIQILSQQRCWDRFLHLRRSYG